MLLTITTTHKPASDLGYLLHKHPDQHKIVSLAFGDAHIFYPEASEERCTAALMLDIDPLELVKSFRGKSGPRMLAHYINDRPYVSSSFLTVAMAKAFSTAMSGRSKGRQELCDTAIPLEINLTAVPAKGGQRLLEDLFVPLGYQLTTKPYVLDETKPEWGDSVYCDINLKITARLQDMLSHLYVLIPVMDKEKHYWVSEDEVEKLLKRGEGWLQDHPKRELITNRYLKSQRYLTRMVESVLVSEEESAVDSLEAESSEEMLEKPLNLNQTRYKKVIEKLQENNARRIVDLGCGEGKFVKELLKNKYFTDIVGMDVSNQCLQYAAQRLKLDDLPGQVRKRIQLLHGSLIYKDSRLKGYDAAVCIEVIEHMELDRLDAFEKVLFGYTRPELVIVTTPNREYNAMFENIKPGKLRHPDHRFEWTRQEFQEWAHGVAERNGYQVEFSSIGEKDDMLGAPTQICLFVINN